MHKDALERFFLSLAFVWIAACGPQGQRSSGVKAAGNRLNQETGDPQTESPAEQDQGLEPPNVPFAMMGGGPRHLHISSLPGPETKPRQIAHFRTGARVFASPVIGPDGTIYIGSVDGTFNALRLDGRLRWSYICDKPIFATAAVSLSGTVYVGCDDDTLLAFSTDGTLRWTYRMKQDVDSPPVIGKNGVIYLGGEGLHAVRADGKRVFKVWLGAHVSASPAVRPDDTIVVGSHDHRLYAVLKDGTVAWSFATKGPIRGPVAALANNDVVFGSDDGFIYRLAPLGGVRWKFRTFGPVRAGIAVSDDEMTIYSASMDGVVHALDSKTGKELWRLETAGAIQASPMLDSEGRLYVGSHDHHLYAVDASSGTILWRVDLESEIDSTATIAAGKKLVVGCDDGTVHVLEGQK